MEHIFHTNEYYLEQINKIDELRKQDAGEELTNFTNYEEALNLIKQRYDNHEALAYCPDAITISYNGKDYKLAVVLGVDTPKNSGMNPHGMAHYLSKHAYTNKNKTKPTAQNLINAAKDIKNALNNAIKKRNILFDEFKNELIFSNGAYIYIVCLAKDENELNYLQTLFPDDRKHYIQNKKDNYKKLIQREIPPNRTKGLN